MQNKCLVLLILLSAVLVGAFGWKIHRDRFQVYRLTIATGSNIISV